MKKLILVVAAIAITFGAYAQSGSTNKKVSPPDRNTNQNQNVQNTTVDKSRTDGYTMQNGKIMQVKNGQTTLLDKSMTTTNGTKINTDGTCINKDGSKTTFKEGQHMDMSGKMSSLKTDKDKNMYLVPDSTRKNNKN